MLNQEVTVSQITITPQVKEDLANRTKVMGVLDIYGFEVLEVSIGCGWAPSTSKSIE